MNASFADSNTLLYLASGDAGKAETAEDILKSGATVSVQVLNEIANVIHRKWNRSWDETEAFLDLVRGLTRVVPVTIETHERGLYLARRHRLGVYDGMIVAAALLAECDRLYSEDMHDSLLIEDRLLVIDPFARA